HFFKRFVKKATRIITISEYSKADISSFYKVDAQKIDNVSCGISSNFKPLSNDAIKSIRDKWSNGKPYFFFIGSMHPRKNIKRLIEGYNLFRAQYKTDIKLLLGGSILWSKSEIEDSYINSPHKDDIIFTGRLSDADLQDLLGAAFALSFVPIFEGFGLPIVEAMQSDIPVICSNVTSMPEVGGDAVLYADPFDVKSIAAAMERMIAEPGLREALIEKGRKQKEKFSWDNTAMLFWNSIQKAL
ncbi:MAG TPA: glycosyltransferase family 1 protein, partial [Ferruginibacter sp.]|nr:glycosyltransferase family 1 protein [Ferruginibacter sp.]